MARLLTRTDLLLKHVVVAVSLGSGVLGVSASSLVSGWCDARFASTAPVLPEPHNASPAARYALMCAGCHGWQGRGDGPEVPFLATAPPDLTRASTWAARSPEELTAIVRDGTEHMPGYGEALDEQTISGLLEMVKRDLVVAEPVPTVAVLDAASDIRDGVVR